MSAPLLVAIPDAELGGELEDWGPREGADSGSPMMSGRIFHDADGFQVGLWECTPGGWHIENRPDSETVRILRGRARLTNDDGDSVELTAGDVLVLPKGWSGRWDILETVRKFYATAK